jgi:hypothetical protein
MVPSGVGSFGVPSPRRHGMGASLTPIKTTPQMENAPTAHATMTVPPRMVAPWSKTSLPSQQHHAHHGGSRRKSVLGSPPPSKR